MDPLEVITSPSSFTATWSACNGLTQLIKDIQDRVYVKAEWVEYSVESRGAVSVWFWVVGWVVLLFSVWYRSQVVK